MSIFLNDLFALRTARREITQMALCTRLGWRTIQVSEIDLSLIYLKYFNTIDLK